MLVVSRVVDVADEEAEVQRGGQDDEETEDDFFEVHASILPFQSSSTRSGG